MNNYDSQITPAKENYKIISPFKMFIKGYFPFIEDTMEALDNYGLLCKVVEYLNNVIDNENTMIDNVNSLYTAFSQLQTEIENYINEYKSEIDNEINEMQSQINQIDENLLTYVNNKLNTMATDGTLQSLLNNYANLQIVYNTVSDMIADDNLIVGNRVKVLGYYNVGDGGQGEYIIKESSTNYAITLHNELVAEFIETSPVNILSLGAKPDDTTFDNYTILNIAINTIKNDIYIPKGNFHIKQSLIANKTKNIYGVQATSILTFHIETGNCLTVGNSICLHDLTIQGYGDTTTSIVKYDASITAEVHTYPSTSQFRNLRIESLTETQIDSLFNIAPSSTYGVAFEDLILGTQFSANNVTYALKLLNTSSKWFNNLIFKNININIKGTNITPVYIHNLYSVHANKCYFENIYIQIRNSVYDRIFDFLKLSDFTIINCGWYDESSGTFNNDNPVIYDNCGLIYIANSNGKLLQINATVNNIISSTYYTGYNSNLVTNYNENRNILLDINLESYNSSDIVPILFPQNLGSYGQYSEIEIYPRYTPAISVNGGGIYIKNRTGGLTGSNYYLRDLFIIYNQYNGNPFIYKIETTRSGLVIWVKGGHHIYIRYLGSSIPKIAVGIEVSNLGSTPNTRTLAVQSIGDLEGLPKTNQVKYFYQPTSITTWT